MIKFYNRLFRNIFPLNQISMIDYLSYRTHKLYMSYPELFVNKDNYKPLVTKYFHTISFVFGINIVTYNQDNLINLEDKSFESAISKTKINFSSRYRSRSLDSNSRTNNISLIRS